jgi:hypothetical protein
MSSLHTLELKLIKQVNIDSIRGMLEAARHAKKTASGDLVKFIFTSSLAVYGGKLPDVVDSTTITTPEGAYGTGKLVAELLVNEYSRRGLIDGRILRLPTIVVRPGVPSVCPFSCLLTILTFRPLPPRSSLVSSENPYMVNQQSVPLEMDSIPPNSASPHGSHPPKLPSKTLFRQNTSQQKSSYPTPEPSTYRVSPQQYERRLQLSKRLLERRH